MGRSARDVPVSDRQERELRRWIPAVLCFEAAALWHWWETGDVWPLLLLAAGLLALVLATREVQR